MVGACCVTVRDLPHLMLPRCDWQHWTVHFAGNDLSYARDTADIHAMQLVMRVLVRSLSPTSKTSISRSQKDGELQTGPDEARRLTLLLL